jgi:hypothetical protein
MPRNKLVCDLNLQQNKVFWVKNKFSIKNLNDFSGIVALADHCRCLRELSLSYNLLSDNLLAALSSEEHVRLEYLRIDIYGEKDAPFMRISPQCWRVRFQKPQIFFPFRNIHKPNVHFMWLPTPNFFLLIC